MLINQTNISNSRLKGLDIHKSKYRYKILLCKTKNLNKTTTALI